MAYFLLFLLETAALFFISKRLINSLAQVLYRIFKSHKAVVSALAILFLPGTIIHELAHLLTAGIMLVPVGEITVVPEFEEKGVRLGSVQIGHSDPFRKTFIGVAPVLAGIGSILGILYFAQVDKYVLWQNILALYLVFAIGNTMFSSKKDLEGSIGFLVAILGVTVTALLAFYFLNPNLLQQIRFFLTDFSWGPVVNFFKTSSIYLLVPLGLDLIIILFTAPLVKRH